MVKSDPDAAAIPLRRHVTPVAPEGDGGYSVTWWPVCIAADVVPGRIVGADFLGGRVIVVRDRDRRAQVLSAYCPHVGADLCVGEMVDGSIRCAFHHWRYSAEGICVATGVGDPAPPNARLFRFPTVERYGLIWAFNGAVATWPFPDLFPRADEGLVILSGIDPGGDFPVDAWVLMANTPDWNHLIVVHHLAFDFSEVNDGMTFHEHSFHYRLKAQMNDGAGPEIEYDRWVYGTNIFVMYGLLGGKWFGAVSAILQVRPGLSRHFYIIAVPKTGSDAAAVAADNDHCRRIAEVGLKMANEDRDIMRTIKFRPGIMTRADTGLARFLNYVRRFPRAHAAADFIS